MYAACWSLPLRGQTRSNASMAGQRTTRLGIDTGGTFTDIVRMGPDGRQTHKVASTPARPEEAFLAALESLGGAAPEAAICHGTTVGTNAVLTRGGVRVAFVTTAGFEDLPWIDRGHRDDLHALAPSRVAPLLERRLSFGLEERVDALGAVVRAPTKAALRELVARVERARPEAVAVCLLHAVQNPAHERAVERVLRPLGVPIHLSSRTCADPREVERGRTTVLSAYVSPLLRQYLGVVARALPASARKRFSVMRSDGGRMTVRDVGVEPVRTLLSGPAAGVAAAAELVARVGEPRALSFDVGGTSTDVAWIEGDDLPVRPSLQVGPFEASVPSIGLETVGAGGGSIVELDAGGALLVGPRSAGAAPGPACYGQGGPFTLTDAWLLLDRLPAALLGGEFPLDRKAAEVRGRPLARAGGMTLPRFCLGVVAVAAAATARALRLASVAGGRDPRAAALVAFGGAGPALACDTAERLGIRTVYVPSDPGTFAAEGTLLAPFRADEARVVTTVAPRRLAGLAETLSARVRRRLEGEGARHILLRVEVDARYEGQAFEVTVPHGPRWPHRFHEAHAAHYGFADPGRGVECVRLRVRGEGRARRRRRSRSDAPATRFRTRPRRGRTAILRDSLRPGTRVLGPLRIDEHTGTTWVAEGWQAEVPLEGLLRLRRTR